MCKIKIGDIVRIITPIAECCLIKVGGRKILKVSSSLKDNMVGERVTVIFVSRAKNPIVRVKKGKKIYTSRFTGWEFRKINIINIVTTK